MDAPYTPFIERAPRKTPIGIWVGTRDPLFPVEAVRRTRDQFAAQGFSVHLMEIPGHTHWYYDRAPEINKEGGRSSSSTRFPASRKIRFTTFRNRSA